MAKIKFKMENKAIYKKKLKTFPNVRSEKLFKLALN